MARFIVKFLKDVTGDNGKCAEVCQSVLEVDASSPVEAIEQAKDRFCKQSHLSDWSLHADRMSIAPGDFLS